MNKNEQQQFKKFKEILISVSKNYKDDIFFGANKVEVANIKGYDAIVSFAKRKKKYVQLTTMSNLIIEDKYNIQHANEFDLELKGNFNEKVQKEKVDKLKKIGINRMLLKNDSQSLHVADSFLNVLDHEEDLDNKYNIKSANLLNALFRAICKKIDKYNLDIKQENSCLVIIDKSPNVFYWPQINNLQDSNKRCETNLAGLYIQKYFNYILKIGTLESNFEKQNFFDEIQVYFRQEANNFEDFFMSNTLLCSTVNLEKDQEEMSRVVTISMKTEVKIQERIKK